jgi:integrase
MNARSASTSETCLGQALPRLPFGRPDEPVPRQHTRPDANALVFTGIKGGPLRRSGFNKLSGWPHVVTGMGLPGLHVHDLRHTGTTLAADMGVSLRNLMARMGHDNERAALIYQHKSSPADRQIADGLDALLRTSRDRRTDDDGSTGALAPGELMAP